MTTEELASEILALSPRAPGSRSAAENLSNGFCFPVDVLHVLRSNSKTTVKAAQAMLPHMIADVRDGDELEFTGKYIVSLVSKMTGSRAIIRDRVGDLPLCFRAPANQPSRYMLSAFENNITPVTFMAAVNMVQFTGLASLANMYFYRKDTPSITRNLAERYGSSIIHHAAHLALERAGNIPDNTEIALESYLSMEDSGVNMIDVMMSLTSC